MKIQKTEMEFVAFDARDVITTSGIGGAPYRAFASFTSLNNANMYPNWYLPEGYTSLVVAQSYDSTTFNTGLEILSYSTSGATITFNVDPDHRYTNSTGSTSAIPAGANNRWFDLTSDGSKVKDIMAWLDQNMQ